MKADAGSTQRAAALELLMTGRCLVCCSSTCGNVTVDPCIQLPDCSGSPWPHPHQEMLIIIHIAVCGVDSSTAPVLSDGVEVGGPVMAVQAVLVRCPSNVGLLHKQHKDVVWHLQKAAEGMQWC